MTKSIMFMEDKKTSETNPEENINKTPSKMARMAWPKAKYGVILAVIIIIFINIIYYLEAIISFFK